MTPDRHRHIGELYHRALTTPDERRSALLDEACANDVDLRSEVESLLAADADAGGFMEAPAVYVAARLVSLDAPPAPASIGRYRLLSVIGRGGMGEVHLAEDSALRRKVAIKLLPAPLIDDEQAVGRFEQEARAASSLNHPNIVTIYEIGTFDDGRFIAMEFVEGQPLSAIVGRPIPPDTLLAIARQLAQALAVAHAAGIVHRDIKPENVMLRPDGYVKLLDFGVARLGHAQLDGSDTPFETRAGVIVGTPRYMSPEQIRGEAATAASDIFALGAVLYELATGRHPSDTGTAPTVAQDSDAITQQTPSRFAPQAPASFTELVRRMLAQDPMDRPSATQIVSEVGSVASTSRRTRLRRPVAAGVAALAAVTALGVFISRQAHEGSPATGPDYRFQIEPPPNATFSASAASLALSPDGRSLAFTASDPARGFALWVQSLDSLKPRRISGTDGAGQIFWSPDSRSVAFADMNAQYKLMSVDLTRSMVRPVSDIRLGKGGVGAWSHDGGIIVRVDDTLYLIPNTGPAVPVTTIDASRGETGHSFPSFIGDGPHFLFVAASTKPEHDGIVYLASIGSMERNALFKSDSQVVYSPPGYLLYMLDSTLVARRFDPKSLRVTSEPIVIADEVLRNPQARRGAFTVSETGVLAYRQHNETELVWYDRSGRRLGSLGPPGPYRNPALSPDGKQVAVAKLDYRTGTWDVWTLDVERGSSTRITSEPSLNDMPVWSPDGRDIAFKSVRGREAGDGMRVYRRSAGGGPAELVVDDPAYSSILHAWTGDGLLYSAVRAPSDLDLFRAPLSGDRSVRQLTATRFVEVFCQPSFDGHWMAYGSNETGVFEIYGAAYPSASGKWLLSVGGGTEPAWRGDGKELFYLSADRQLMSVAVTAGSELRGDPPKVLFQTALPSAMNPTYTRNQYIVAPDGQRFLVNEPVRKPSSSSVTVIVNWPALMRHPGS